MKRRLFAMILAVSLLFSLAACAEKAPTAVPEQPKGQPSEPESDARAADLPEWLFEVDRAELRHHVSLSSYRRAMPEAQLASLLQALPQWVGAPLDAADAEIYDGSDTYQFYFYQGTALLGTMSFKLQEGWMNIRTTSDEYSLQDPDAYYRFSTTAEKPDLAAIYELCTPRQEIPKPASMQLISPEGQTVELPAAEAADLAEQLNAALAPSYAVHMPNEADCLIEGEYWILRITTETGEEIALWLDCYTPVSPLYPWYRFADSLGSMAFGLTRDEMAALKELLQSYME